MPVPKVIRIIGWIEIGANLVVGVLVTLVMTLVYLNNEDPGDFFFPHWIMLGSAGLLLIMNGFFVSRGSVISRYIMGGLSVIRLIGVPVGTVWGIASFYFLFFHPDAKAYYASKKSTGSTADTESVSE